MIPAQCTWYRIAVVMLALGFSGCCQTPHYAGERAAPKGILSKLMPPISRSGSFNITQNEKADEYSFTFKPIGAGRWLWDVPGQHTATYLWLVGGLAIESEIDYEQQVVITYTPALLVLPYALAPDEPLTQNVKVKVTTLRSNAARASGTCRSTLKWIGAKRAVVPAGEFDCTRLHESRDMKLTVARAKVSITTDYAANKGIIAQRVNTVTRTLGLMEAKTNVVILRSE